METLEKLGGSLIHSFWKDRRVFLTGHTGFKGSWLSIWLHAMGARVSGFALAPPTDPSLFVDAELERIFAESVRGDVRDLTALSHALKRAKPEVVFHLAAQPLVRESYLMPVETFQTNVMGTVHLFEAIRHVPSIRAVINVTSDKCYRNRELARGYQESDELGGFDPYSSSKACSELVTASYRSSFFQDNLDKCPRVGLASVRAGNVIGGGDWAKDRLVPDVMRALLEGRELLIRNPESVRPWQSILEPLKGYLLLAEALFKDARSYSEAWNFGPPLGSEKAVRELADFLISTWAGKSIKVGSSSSMSKVHETQVLRVDSSKAEARLGWKPLWSLEKTLTSVVEWTRAYVGKEDLYQVTLGQIEEYERGL